MGPTSGSGGGGSKREAELVRLLAPSGGGRPDGADHPGGDEENITTLV
jgi:hypothetical protein